jgi:hypothetical protein
MAGELTFKDEAAAEYDRAFAHVTAYFMPFLLRAAHIAPGMRVLDVATGTGLCDTPTALGYLRLSNRPLGKRFQTIQLCGVDVTRGPAFMRCGPLSRCQTRAHI